MEQRFWLPTKVIPMQHALRGQGPVLTPVELTRNAVYRRAVEAAIWGIPLVNVDSMRQPYFQAGARYNDCIFWSEPNTWMNQTATPNHSTNYVIFFIRVSD
jgi:hypothetical protein